MELNYGEKKQKIWTTYPNSEKSIPNRPVGPRPLTATPPNNLGYMTLVTLICIFLIISGTYICSFVRDKSYSSEKAHYWFACHNFCRLSRSILPDSTSKIKQFNLNKLIIVLVSLHLLVWIVFQIYFAFVNKTFNNHLIFFL